jgi:hypothetical protein
VTHIYIKPASSQCSPASRVASAAGRLRPNAVTGVRREKALTLSGREIPPGN